MSANLTPATNLILQELPVFGSITLTQHRIASTKNRQAGVSSITPQSFVREGDVFSAFIGGHEHYFRAAAVVKAGHSGWVAEWQSTGLLPRGSRSRA